MKTLREYIEFLEGIKKTEWITLKHVMDRAFENKQKEIDASIRISRAETEAVIRSTFPKGTI